MKTLFIILLLSLCMSAQITKPTIASIDGPCSQIENRKCYNAYESNGQSWFGFYSFDDASKKVTLTEKFDCEHPNGRMRWGKASNTNPNGSFPVWNSRKVKGL